MHGLILAAGYGTRLKEYGEKTPKGLIPYQKSVLVEHVITEFLKNGIDTITLVTNERYKEVYRKFLSSKSYKIQVLSDGMSDPEHRLGGLGDLLFVLETLKLNNRDLLVAPSDTYFAFSFSKFLSQIALHPGDFCTVFRKMNEEEIRGRLGCATLEKDRVVAFIEKPEHPPSLFGAVPFYYYPSKVLKLLTNYKMEGNSMDAPGSIIPWLLKKKLPVYAYAVTSPTLDVGTVSDVRALQEL